MPTTEEDEWEYEYDEDETEDFYVPIDLSNAPKTQGPVTALPKVGHPVLMQSRLRSSHERRTAANTNATVNLSGAAPSIGDIQLSGLHTPNPLVVYNGYLLSCQWAANVGTNMFFARPLRAPQEEEVLRKLPGVELLANSSAKLIAKEAQLRPRVDLFEGGFSMSLDDPPTENPGAAPSNDEGEPTPQTSTFLDKLNAAKAKRGEKSRLVVSKEADGVHLTAEPTTEEPRHSAENETGGDVDMVGV